MELRRSAGPRTEDSYGSNAVAGRSGGFQRVRCQRGLQLFVSPSSGEPGGSAVCRDARCEDVFGRRLLGLAKVAADRTWRWPDGGARDVRRQI